MRGATAGQSQLVIPTVAWTVYVLLTLAGTLLNTIAARLAALYNPGADFVQRIEHQIASMATVEFVVISSVANCVVLVLHFTFLLVMALLKSERVSYRKLIALSIAIHLASCLVSFSLLLASYLVF